MIKKIILVTTGLLLCGAVLAKADTVLSKNGRTMEGFILEENPESVQVDVGFGKVGLKRSEIESIVRSDEEGSDQLRAKWARQKAASEQRAKDEKLKEELAPKRADITEDRGQIVVEALLNKKVTATLILDTGASLVVIKDNIAQQLGINTAVLKGDIKLRLADGRESTAKHAVLPSVSVQGAEALNVDVADLIGGRPGSCFKRRPAGYDLSEKFQFQT